MRNKASMIKEFINTHFFSSDANVDIEDEYKRFEKKTLEDSVAEF